MKKCAVRPSSPATAAFFHFLLIHLLAPPPPTRSILILPPSLCHPAALLLSPQFDSISSTAPEWNRISFTSTFSCIRFAGVRREGSGAQECDCKHRGRWNRSVPSSAAWEKNIQTSKELSQET